MRDCFLRRSYSQFGEDGLIAELLRESHGFYADIGARDPWRYSNTALLFERGWRGINVDADPRAIERFSAARPNDINIDCGVGASEGEIDFSIFDDGAVNTFDEGLAMQQRLSFGPSREIRIRIQRLVNIFREYIPEGIVIDYLNVDCEGLDEQVLNSNDWQCYRPKVVSAELHNLNLERVSEHPTFRFMKGAGYVMRGHYYATSIFQSIESI